MVNLEPFFLDQSGTPSISADDSGGLPADPIRLRARAGDDLFNDPWSENSVARLSGQGAWVTDRAFTFSARVHVELAATFDSSVLLGWASPQNWFKLCVEQDPQGRARIVSVVTRSVSDDANGAYLTEPSAWLRIARGGSSFALHTSATGASWDLVRVFRLDTVPVDRLFVGIAVQSPTGTGTVGSFSDLRFEPAALTNVRNGS